MEEKKRKAAIEAILFTMGDAVELNRIAEAIGEDPETTLETIRTMTKDYTKIEYYDDLIRIAKHPKKPALSDVAMETLSIVAYKQPVTKIEIEKIRGVKCDHAINKLIEYNLIRELGRLDAPGRPILFGTTEEFLRNFGVQSLEELPAINPVQVEDFKAEAEEEVELRLNV